MMKAFKIFSIIAITLLLQMGAIDTADAADNAKESNLKVYNSTGQDIYYLYITPTYYNGLDWFDLLGEGILEDNKSVLLKDYVKYQYYDVKIVFKDKAECHWYRLDLSNAKKLTFYANGEKFTVKIDA